MKTWSEIVKSKELGERMRLNRKMKGYTIEEFARMADVCAATICLFETGKYRSIPRKYNEMCDLLGIEPFPVKSITENK
jgi:transcriptional regulator with XRE-family HTH domain